ncbi:MAG: phytanoyl-CoA dioxygenase family protein [Chitinophagales bacterium]|nr:phytanoyl-CoA dioxygenase family protein [Chitinophagales bacterium]
MIQVPPIFKNEALQALYDRQGYVQLQLFNEAEIASLTELFYRYHPEVPDDRFMSDSYSSDAAFKKQASISITEYFLPKFEEHLKDYTPFGSSFLYKTPGKGSELAMHQDWTIVDETKYQALNIWVPLCDADEHNGALYVLPGSHLHILPLRAPTLPFFFSGNESMLMPYLQPMHSKAGQAVILNQRLIHYSPPNLSDRIRIAITSGVKTKDAQMVFHYKAPDNKDDTVEVYEQDDDFLISFNNFYSDIMMRPYLGRRIADKQYRIPSFNNEELASLLEKMRLSAGSPAIAQPSKASAEQDNNLWQKIRKLMTI